MITYEYERPFNFDAVDNVFAKLKAVKGIDTFTVSEEGCNEIRNLLNLNDNMTEMEIRAIRNAVVKRFSGEQNLLRAEEQLTGKISIKKYMDLENHLSAITSVCDEILWNKGYEV